MGSLRSGYQQGQGLGESLLPGLQTLCHLMGRRERGGGKEGKKRREEGREEGGKMRERERESEHEYYKE